MASQTFDVVIVGAGIVGLTVAHGLMNRNPALRIGVLEKEEKPGKHASGRNSGVMHCGIFYGADTIKAKVCATGSARMQAFAAEHGIACDRGGKLVLATQESQLPAIEKLLKNAADNQIRAERMDAKQASEIEPFAAPAAAAIYCPDTAVIDSNAVLARLTQLLTDKGVKIIFNAEVTGLAGPKQLSTRQGTIGYGYLINCAGAYADRIAKFYGCAGDYVLVPFKGLYWKLSPESNPKVRANIYPVPDPALPFLGVHLTRVISGDVYVGPTAIPALGRENYHGLEGVSASETLRIIKTLATMYAHNQQNFRLLTHNELAKYHKRWFYQSAQKLMPSLRMADMVRSPKAGIRPQLVNLATHKLEMDYIFEETPDSLHVLNTISPAFTSSLAFADMIIERSHVA